MRVDVNGTPHEVQAETLSALLDELGFEAPCVATAVDGIFVPRTLRDAHPLSPGARIEILAPMQGG